MSVEVISRPIGSAGRLPQYGRRQQNPVRRYAGIAVVLLLHVLLIWALTKGLANKVVQIVQKPIETKIIEPVKPPPPPPMPTVQLPPPKFTPPPPPFVPPHEVPVAPPPVATITHQSTPVPTAPVLQPAPAAPVTPPTPPTPARPVSHAVGVVCPNSDEVRRSMGYPQEAQENDITGNVTISFVVDPEGHVTDEKVDQSANPILDHAAFVAVKKFNCISQGQPVRVQVPFSFNLN